MRPYLVVIFHVRQQYMTEVSLAEHHNVVKALPSDRSDQPCGISVLPWGARRCRPVTNAHRSKSSDEDLTIGPIPVTDQVAGSLFPTACFRDLICDPFCSGVSCDAKPQNLSSAVPHDQQSIEQAKRDRRHDEQIHRRDAVGMVMKKRLPALRRWPSSLHHILGHAGLADIDAELKQLSVDPRRAPQRVGAAHLADKLAYLCRAPSRMRTRLSGDSTLETAAIRCFPLSLVKTGNSNPKDFGFRACYP